MACPKKPKRQKPKTHKGVAKRVKITGTGKVLMGRPGRRHLAIGKTAKRKRQLRRKIVLTGTFAKNYKAAVRGNF
jgi:large subunit ribosomal protein L35